MSDSHSNEDRGPCVPPNTRDAAIVGMACRCAGHINSPSELWEFLLNKGDASGNIEPWRWAAYHQDSKSEAALQATTSSGYFMDNIKSFDASFFSISPSEAEQMDPQQRIALEVAWEALEDAGIPPTELAGSSTAVYMGVSQDDYAKLVLNDLPNIQAHMGVGTSHCGVPGRISYQLGLKGPHSAIDAACASSLVAIHLARQAILTGEASLAIAGGVNVLLSPSITRVLDKAGATSPDGKCRSFDDSAQGYGRGEGVGIVILKALDRATADGDHVQAILKGTAVMSDGRTDGIMAPSADSQKMVAYKALSQSNIYPEHVQYVEAHATSTFIGDPVEVGALDQVYGKGCQQGRTSPCCLGCLKPNIGHLESAAGVMSLIKSILVLQKKIVPPQANLTTLNSRIPWEEYYLQPCQERTPLPDSNSPLRSAVASYGYSGVVSHAIIEASPQASSYTTVNDLRTSEALSVLFISAPQEELLPMIAARLKDWISQQANNYPVQEIASTLNHRRSHYRFRSAIIAQSNGEAISGLSVLSSGSKESRSCIVNGRVTPGATKGAVWVFSGHGSHWTGMGQELYRHRPAFVRVLHNLEPIFQRHLGLPITEIIRDGKEITGTDTIHAMTFVMHLGIAAVLEEEAGPPSAVVGHSLGEVAAGVVSGIITQEEAAYFICQRTQLYRSVLGEGAVMFVSLEANEARRKIRGVTGVSIAIETSPSSCVVSGEPMAIRTLATELTTEEIETHVLPTDVAFHSPLLSKLVDPFREALHNKIHPKAPRIRFYSTAQHESRASPENGIEYWVHGMLWPVQFHSGIVKIVRDGFRAFVEVSSHPIVSRAIQEIVSQETKDACLVTTTGIRNQSIEKNILRATASLHCFGCHISHTKPNRNDPWIHGVPPRLWQHKSFWHQTHELKTAPVSEQKKHSSKSYNLLGERVVLFGSKQVLYRTYLDENNRPYPASHTIRGSEIIPISILLNTVFSGASTNCLDDMILRVPIVVVPPQELQVQVGPHKVQIVSKPLDGVVDSNSSWLINTVCRHNTTNKASATTTLDVRSIRGRLHQNLSPDFTREYLASTGVPSMAFPWKVLEHICGEVDMLARVDLDFDGQLQTKGSWAPLFDAATSIGSIVFRTQPMLRMVHSIKRVVVTGYGQSCPRVCYVYCSKSTSDTENSAIDMILSTEDGTVLAEFNGFSFKAVEGTSSSPLTHFTSRPSVNSLLHYVAWPPARWEETPRHFQNVAFLTTELTPKLRFQVDSYQAQLRHQGIESPLCTRSSLPSTPDTAIVYVPDLEVSLDNLSIRSSQLCEVVVNVAQQLITETDQCSRRLFIVVRAEDNLPSLASAPLYGLSRIISAEHPEIWGGLIECEDNHFPLAVLRYIHDRDIIRIQDGVARTACFRSFSNDSAEPSTHLRFSKSGTYMIAGGLGGIGLECARWMVESGARRLILVSRRQMPPRQSWHEKTNDRRNDDIIRRITSLEEKGATIQHISIDISSPNAAVSLNQAIEKLQLPPILGVIHAAGVTNDQLVSQITTAEFNATIAPKVQGSLCLNQVFSPGRLDFFLLFSSVGHLLGFPGQASYASGNAFLDALAARRRAKGDNAVSFQWSTWKGIGMGAQSEYTDAELKTRSLSGISREEAFMAWTKVVSDLDTDHVAVFRAVPMSQEQPMAYPILREVVTRKTPTDDCQCQHSGNLESLLSPPSASVEKESLDQIITSCAAKALSIPSEEIDPLTSFSEMGMDSVLAVTFRANLQQKLNVQFPPTLTWRYPTVKHLARHFSSSELLGLTRTSSDKKRLK